jgi:hypothetical protein
MPPVWFLFSIILEKHRRRIPSLHSRAEAFQENPVENLADVGTFSIDTQ